MILSLSKIAGEFAAAGLSLMAFSWQESGAPASKKEAPGVAGRLRKPKWVKLLGLGAFDAHTVERAVDEKERNDEEYGGKNEWKRTTGFGG